MVKAKSITGLDVQAPTIEIARIVTRIRLGEMYQWAPSVDDPFRVQELHNLRIAAKRLRYTLEIFEDVFPESCGLLIKEVERIQEELGALHDSDVLIALLRLCLGGQDSGPGYEYVLAKAAQYQAKGKFVLNPDLVAHLIDPTITPSAEQRQGLEILLRNLQQRREEQYVSFRQHWYQLQARDFRREVLDMLSA
jgi:CHAD domain-containing protein